MEYQVMLNDINALKLLVTAQALIDFTNNCGYNNHSEASQKQFDVCQNFLADVVELVGVSQAKYAFSKVLQNCNLFNEETISFVENFLDDQEALEKEEI